MLWFILKIRCPWMEKTHWLKEIKRTLEDITLFQIFDSLGIYCTISLKQALAMRTLNEHESNKQGGIFHFSVRICMGGA